MNKVYASVASVGFLVLGSQAGCSSADPPPGSGGTTSVGATSNVAGSTAIPAGGTGSGTAGTGAAGTPSPTAGTGAGGAGTGGSGTAGTGTAGTPTGGTGTADPACKGIKTGVACAPEATQCAGLACGLADSGTRSCNCAATWMCQACDYSASPFKDKPAEVLACSGIEADKVPCTEADKGKVCQSAGGEVCACWTDDETSLIWDCDKPPTTWAAAM